MEPTNPASAARALMERFARWQRPRGVDPHGPVDLRHLLKMLDLCCEESPELFDPEGGRVIGELNRVNRVVRVSEGFGARTKRFTIAHEIAHHELHRDLLHHRDVPGSVLGLDVRRQPRETEANDFAAELLMPEERFTTAFHARFEVPLVLGALSDHQIYRLGLLGNQREVSRGEVEKRGLAFLAELAGSCAFYDTSGHASLSDAFEVSTSAAATRLRNLGLVRLEAPIARGKPPRVQQKIPAPGVTLSNAALPPAASSSPFDLRPASPSLSTFISAHARAEQPAKAVALIGDYPQHWKNRRLLKERGWAVLDDDSTDAVEKLRRDPPCGVVVHSSFWKDLRPAQREEAVRTLAELSSFIVVRLDLTGMTDADSRVFETAPGVLADRLVGAYRQTSDGQLDDADFLALERVLEVRQRTKQIVLQTDTSLDGPATNLLKLVAAERFSTGTPVVTVERLAAGNSGGQNFVLYQTDNEQPTFAKTNDVRSLAAELQRTWRCHPYVPSLVVPELRFHASLGALLQPFISARGTSTVPAPSLEQFLRNLSESSSQASLFLQSMLPSVLDLFTRLGGARVKEAARHLGCIFHAYESDRKRGLHWVDSPLPSESIDTVARGALETLTTYDQVAMVHGDAHLRNILLKDGTDPVIVDFAHAGPGHPVFDLVRFELAIWTVLLEKADRNVAQGLVGRLLANERIDAKVMRRFEGKGLAIQVALRSSMLIRESCRTVTRGDKHWFNQYRAMHVLLALLAFQSSASHYLSFAVFLAVAPTATSMAV